jgi:hypothetical protein
MVTDYCIQTCLLDQSSDESMPGKLTRLQITVCGPGTDSQIDPAPAAQVLFQDHCEDQRMLPPEHINAPAYNPTSRRSKLREPANSPQLEPQRGLRTV